MKIKESVYNSIMQEQRETPPERGGILGGSMEVITEHQYDEGMSTANMCNYIPNTKRINAEIKKWQQRDIQFMGIYHTHYFDVSTLSDGDKTYIDKIMKSMPEEIEQLYFPLVIMPGKKMVCYIAKRAEESVVIDKEDIVIIQENEMEDNEDGENKRIKN